MSDTGRPPLHRRTSLLHSAPLSQRSGREVFLKLETEQPVRSFKIRGIGRLAQQRADEGATALIASSGGNAGLAAAYAGRQLGLSVTVVVPRTTPEFMRARLREEEAIVLEHGDAWDDAHAHALELLEASDGQRAYVHPFDDPEIWRGHASIIEEDAHGAHAPDTVIVSVGGGGLLCGVLSGMHAVGWNDVPVIAVETEGAASFARSVEAKQLVTLDAITSIATTLGARTVAAEALAWAGRHEVRPHLVTDAEAVRACRRFVSDHDLWVEPACGAALATLDDDRVLPSPGSNVLVIVCGGAGVSPELLSDWEARVGC